MAQSMLYQSFVTFGRTASVASLAVAVACGASGAQSPAAPADPWLRPVATIALPNVSGRIDHLAFDAARQHLFVAALGNDTIEVIDTRGGRHLQSVRGFHEPQGIAVVPELSGVAVANGDTGTLQMIDATTFRTRWTVPIGGDADNVRYDAAAQRLYVAAEGGLFAVNPASGQVLQRIEIAGHPESFQLERDGAGIYANLPGASQIVAADRQRAAIRARWQTGSCRSNYPMALDESTRRLLVGCRNPPTLALVDATRGAFISTVTAVGDTDDLFYDASRKRVYVIGGEGYVDVVERQADALKPLGRIATRRGARTGLWVADERRLYVAVPARLGPGAEIRVFEAPPLP
jgi:DNA-binding beta-propeller fold protein YncE